MIQMSFWLFFFLSLSRIYLKIIQFSISSFYSSVFLVFFSCYHYFKSKSFVHRTCTTVCKGINSFHFCHISPIVGCFLSCSAFMKAVHCHESKSVIMCLATASLRSPVNQRVYMKRATATATFDLR